MKRMLSALVLVFMCCGLLSGCGETKKEIPKYELGVTSDYVQDGQECMAYRVIVDPEISDDDMKLVYEDIIKDDGYYLHTVWFYDSMESGADGTNMYNIGAMEEIEKDKTPDVVR